MHNIRNLIYLLKTLQPEYGYILWTTQTESFKYSLNKEQSSRYLPQYKEIDILPSIKEFPNIKYMFLSVPNYIILPDKIKQYSYTNDLFHEISINNLKEQFKL